MHIIVLDKIISYHLLVMITVKRINDVPRELIHLTIKTKICNNAFIILLYIFFSMFLIYFCTMLLL